jgi:hypothetical protein
MMGWQSGDQSQFFYLFNLEDRIPPSHLLRRINPTVTQVVAELREKLKPFYSEIGRPSIDPELISGRPSFVLSEKRLRECLNIRIAKDHRSIPPSQAVADHMDNSADNTPIVNITRAR